MDILNWIRGFEIPFCSPVFQKHIPREPSWTKKESSLISDQLSKLLENGVVHRCSPENGQFISNIFLSQKPDGSYRMILNLKHLNEFINPNHFKLEDHRTAVKLLHQDCFMATVDLKDAYYLIAVNKKHRKYLRFKFQGELFEFSVLPFGLNCAPLIFTKLMRPIVMILRKAGFLSVIYLDDFLLMGKTYLKCLENLKKTISLLESLGFIINWKKSNVIPSKYCKYLGLMLNSEKMQLELPREKRLDVLALLNKHLKYNKCKIRDFAALIGTLGFCCNAAAYGWVYVKNLEREKIKILEKYENNYDVDIKYNSKIFEDLIWWQQNIMIINKPVQELSFSLEIFSDSSTSGWGAHCNNESIHGYWNAEEREYHINVLEILAAFFGLKSFAKNAKNCHILLRIDNTTAISYVNRMGGTHSKKLCEVAKEIWKWCEKRSIWIVASYIRSKDNVVADYESRRLEPETEFELSQKAYNNLVKIFGQPNIDLFASRANTKCKLYVSWKRDPGSITVDAFTINWKNYFFYAFPPFSIILKVLVKIKQEGSRGIVIVPNWPTQAWYPLYMDMLVSQPVIFEPNINLLRSSNREPHPLWRQLSLMAGVLSKKPSQ